MTYDYLLLIVFFDVTGNNDVNTWGTVESVRCVKETVPLKMPLKMQSRQQSLQCQSGHLVHLELCLILISYPTRLRRIAYAVFCFNEEIYIVKHLIMAVLWLYIHHLYLKAIIRVISYVILYINNHISYNVFKLE